MGIDSGDVDGDGWTDLVIGNFAQEMSAVYLGVEGRLFQDQAARLGVGLPSLMQVAFGTVLVDLDLDGRLDLVFIMFNCDLIKTDQLVKAAAQP